jgi:hypothetical protein
VDSSMTRGVINGKGDHHEPVFRSGIPHGMRTVFAHPRCACARSMRPCLSYRSMDGLIDGSAGGPWVPNTAEPFTACRRGLMRGRAPNVGAGCGAFRMALPSRGSDLLGCDWLLGSGEDWLSVRRRWSSGDVNISSELAMR